MKATRIAGGLAALALAVGLGACGGGGGASSSPRAAAAAGLSRSELAAKADAICAAAQAKAQTIASPANIGSDATAAAAYFDKVLPITDRETRRLQALVPAPTAADDWRAFLTAQIAADQLLQTLKRKADAKDPSGLADLAKEQPAFRRIADAARRIGARTCG